jgi:hypothetical protein
MPFDLLPPGFPTQAHSPAFWEALGRAVATFGFLGEMLGKAYRLLMSVLKSERGAK